MNNEKVTLEKSQHYIAIDCIFSFAIIHHHVTGLNSLKSARPSPGSDITLGLTGPWVLVTGRQSQVEVVDPALGWAVLPVWFVWVGLFWFEYKLEQGV